MEARNHASLVRRAKRGQQLTELVLVVSVEGQHERLAVELVVYHVRAKYQVANSLPSLEPTRNASEQHGLDLVHLDHDGGDAPRKDHTDLAAQAKARAERR